MDNFADRLLEAVASKGNPSVIGLDSDLTRLPPSLRERFRDPSGSSESSEDPFESACSALVEFNRTVIGSIKDVVPAVKIQSAFYEQYGPEGWKAFRKTAETARDSGLLVIGDLKRGDIGNTSRAYSSAYLGESPAIDSRAPAYPLDAMTLNPYLGSDSLKPFVEDCKKFGKGVFILVKTSNPSSAELQDLESGGERVYEKVAVMVRRLGEGLRGGSGFGPVGAVVGATHPRQAAVLRKLMPESVFLVPGYGSQGGGAKDVVPCFNEEGTGAIIHSARSVIFAYEKLGLEEDYGQAAKQAAIKMREDIAAAMKEAGVCPW